MPTKQYHCNHDMMVSQYTSVDCYRNSDLAISTLTSRDPGIMAWEIRRSTFRRRLPPPLPSIVRVGFSSAAMIVSVSAFVSASAPVFAVALFVPESPAPSTRYR
mmetsp:Transcript_16795/g.46090  ORF Transcript_16795/g.46090 Transcript_16795/m.46090 type:complete len:104 (+) Transcript_16795:2352-2663(+)